MGCCFLLQGIFPTEGLNPCLLQLLWVDSLPLSHVGPIVPRLILKHASWSEMLSSQDLDLVPNPELWRKPTSPDTETTGRSGTPWNLPQRCEQHGIIEQIQASLLFLLRKGSSAVSIQTDSIYLLLNSKVRLSLKILTSSWTFWWTFGLRLDRSWLVKRRS